MKQLPMTPELKQMIQKAVGPDVDPSNFAVFETIALNSKPLPGKRGTQWENAQVMPVTLAQMVDYVNAGNHLPLIADHELLGAPKGRFFHAGLEYTDEGDFEMRALFYVDSTEAQLVQKINDGSLDEVSVSFLSTQFNCSECGFDYFGEGSPENWNNKTCANGHTIGKEGVYAEMVGLNQFIELSLVARGAADKPKIVGKSDAKLAPETTYRLAAHGFEPNALVLHASVSNGESEDMDTTKLMTDLVESKTEVATLTASVAAKDTAIVTLTSERDAAKTRVGELETQLTEANAKIPADHDAIVAQRNEAVVFLQEQVNHLLVASGKPKLEGDALPKTPADLKAKIGELTGNLTSVLPVGGRSQAPGTEKEAEAPLANFAFITRKN